MQPQPPTALDHVETAEINKEIIASAFRWAFERPSRRVTEKLRVPPLPPKPHLREELAAQVDGSEAEVYRFFKPTRWSQGTAPPPWPVGRWWGSWWARQFPRRNDLLPSARAVMVESEE